MMNIIKANFFAMIININLIHASNYFNMVAEESEIPIKDSKHVFFKATTDHSNNLFLTEKAQTEYNKQYVENLRLIINESSEETIKTYFFHTKENKYNLKNFSQKRLIDSGDTASAEFQKLKIAFGQRNKKNLLDELKDKDMHCFASTSQEYYTYQLSGNNQILQKMNEPRKQSYEFKTIKEKTQVLYGYSPISFENIYSPDVWNICSFDHITEELMDEVLKSESTEEFKKNQKILDAHIKNENVLIKFRQSFEHTIKYIYITYRNMWNRYFQVAKAMLNKDDGPKKIVIHSGPIGQGCFLSLIKNTPFELYCNQALIASALDAAIKNNGKINFSDGNSLNVFGDFAQNYFESIGIKNYGEYLDLKTNNFFAEPSSTEYTFYLIPGDPNSLPGGNAGLLKDKSFESLAFGLPPYGRYPEIVMPNMYHMRCKLLSKKELQEIPLEDSSLNQYEQEKNNFFKNIEQWYEKRYEKKKGEADQKKINLLAHIKKENIQNSYYFRQENTLQNNQNVNEYNNNNNNNEKVVDVRSIYEYLTVEVYIPQEESGVRGGRGYSEEESKQQSCIQIRLVFDEENFFKDNQTILNEFKNKHQGKIIRFIYDTTFEKKLKEIYAQCTKKMINDISKEHMQQLEKAYNLQNTYIDNIKTYIKELCKKNGIPFVDETVKNNSIEEDAGKKDYCNIEFSASQDNNLIWKNALIKEVENKISNSQSDRYNRNRDDKIKQDNLLFMVSSICHKIEEVPHEKYNNNYNKFAEMTEGSEVFKNFCNSRFTDVKEKVRRNKLECAAVSSALEDNNFVILGEERNTNDVCETFADSFDHIQSNLKNLIEKLYNFEDDLLKSRYTSPLLTLSKNGHSQVFGEKGDLNCIYKNISKLLKLYACEWINPTSEDNSTGPSERYNQTITHDDRVSLDGYLEKVSKIEDSYFDLIFSSYDYLNSMLKDNISPEDKKKCIETIQNKENRIRLLYCVIFSIISTMIGDHYNNYYKEKKQVYYFPQEIVNFLKYENNKMMKRYNKYSSHFDESSTEEIKKIYNNITSLISLINNNNYSSEEYINISQEVREKLFSLSELLGGVIAYNESNIYCNRHSPGYFCCYKNEFDKLKKEFQENHKIELKKIELKDIKKESKNESFISKYKKWLLVSGIGVSCIFLLLLYFNKNSLKNNYLHSMGSYFGFAS